MQMRFGTWSSYPKTGKLLEVRKWVYKTKKSANGQFERHKAHLVALGYTQKHGQDYDETFSPVVGFASLRMAITLAVQNG